MLKLHGVFLHVVGCVIASNFMDHPDQGESQASLRFGRVCSKAVEAGNEEALCNGRGAADGWYDAAIERTLSQVTLNAG